MTGLRAGGWWHYQMQFLEYSWLMARFKDGLFGPLEIVPAVVDDFGNLVRVDALTVTVNA